VRRRHTRKPDHQRKDGQREKCCSQRDRLEAFKSVDRRAEWGTEGKCRKHGYTHPGDDLAGMLRLDQCQAPGHATGNDEALSHAEERSAE
jgi:hypothetical protein